MRQGKHSARVFSWGTWVGLALLGCTGCLSGEYDQFRTYQPPQAAAVEALVIGQTSVGDAVTGLGAPVFVIETGEGLALAYGWQNAKRWNVTLSAPIQDVDANFSFTSRDAQTPGLVLFFDANWQLIRMERGHLGSLLARQARPQVVE